MKKQSADSLKIAYRRLPKYVLEHKVVVDVGKVHWTAAQFCPLASRHITLDIDGTLTIEAGFPWDGPSGPAVDTKSFMPGSLVHDALYRLWREHSLDERFRMWADKVMRRINAGAGMAAPRRWWTWLGVRVGGRGGGKQPRMGEDVITAP